MKSPSRLPHRQRLFLGRLGRRPEAWDVAVATQAADLVGLEAFSRCCFATLAIEDGGDDFIWVMSCETV